MEKTEIKMLIKQLENNRDNLSQYQVEFISGVKRYLNKYNKLSERQIDTLVNIYKGILVEK